MNQIGSIPNLIGMRIERHTGVQSNKAAEQNRAQLESVGQEFEGVLLSLMLKEMRNTLEDGGFFGEESSDTYGGLFDLFIGQSMAESSPLGIADQLLGRYSKNQVDIGS